MSFLLYIYKFNKIKKNFDVMIINAREVINQDDYKDLFENYNNDE